MAIKIIKKKNVPVAAGPKKHGMPHSLMKLKGMMPNAQAKAKFILATDGDTFEAEDVDSGETVARPYADFPNHFGFFLPLAGITTVKQIREGSFDIRATGRLNRLYVELLKDNPDWGAADRRPDMNHFMARLIFCFFAEDTDIFHRSYTTSLKLGGSIEAADCGRLSFCYTTRRFIPRERVAADCGRLSFCYTATLSGPPIPTAADCGRLSFCYTRQGCRSARSPAADCGRLSFCYTPQAWAGGETKAADCGRLSFCYTALSFFNPVSAAADCGRLSFCYTT